MDRMTILDRSGEKKYLVDSKNLVTDLVPCQHDIDSKTNRCRKCRKTAQKIEGEKSDR